MMFRFLKRTIGDLKIKTKIFVSYIIILFFAFFMVFIINSIIAIRDVREKTMYSAEQVLDQAKSFLGFKTLTTKNVLDIVSANEALLEVLERTPADYRDNVGLWSIDAQAIDRALFYTSTNQDIDRIQLYMEQGPASFLQNKDYLLLDDFKDSLWYNKFLQSGNKLQWFISSDFSDNEGDAYISALRAIPSDKNIQENFGIIKTDIPISVFQTILNQAVFTESSAVAIVDSNDRVLCMSDNMAGHDELMDVIDHLDGKSEDVFETVKAGGAQVLVGSRDIPKTDWRIVMAIPNEDIVQIINESPKQLLFILLLIVPFTFPLAYMISASVTRPISRLIKNMRNVQDGNLDVDILPAGNDEIGVLTNDFNYMLTRIGILMNDKYAMGKEIKNMELKALQAQINPHFLYNTLDQIYWLAVKHNTPVIGNLVLALSRFYKLSLSKGRDTVTIENELAHVEAYVQIQNVRYNDCIRLEVDVPEEIRIIEVPKIILQPIVENAIIHGILETYNEKGTIRITGRIEDGGAVLRISDDGAGMEPDKLEGILTYDSSSDYHGYGIINIHNRIKLCFGADYGLSYESTPQQGTTVSIRFPQKGTD